MRILNFSIIFLIGAIFLFSGIDKLLHIEGFVNALGNYVLIPRWMARPLALPIILVELFIGLSIFAPRTRRLASLAAIGTLAVFSAAVALNGIFGDRGICGCWFTITAPQSMGVHLVQNLLLLGLAWTVAVSCKEPAPVQEALASQEVLSS
ncbi:MAG: MauE/DoxX family redox-associated membrane protein [Actinomycetota bacterium]